MTRLGHCMSEVGMIAIFAFAILLCSTGISADQPLAAAASRQHHPLRPATPPPQKCVRQRPLVAGQLIGTQVRLGTQDNRLSIASPKKMAARIDDLAALHAQAVRIDVLWSNIERRAPRHSGADPRDSSFSWSKLDWAVRGLSYCGITPMFNVYRAPAWANGHPYIKDAAGRLTSADVAERAWMPDVTAYQSFMTALATRYSGRFRIVTGGHRYLVLPRVSEFEAWNEPNMALFLQPQWQRTPDGKWQAISPANYATLLNAAYTAVHSVQPDAIVTGVSGGSGGTTSDQLDSPKKSVALAACTAASACTTPGVNLDGFMRLLAGYHPAMDACAVHLYPRLAPRQPTPAFPSYSTLESRVIPACDAIRLGLPVFITEFGWSTSPTAVRNSPPITETAQKRDFLQAAAIFMSNPRIKLAVWFDLQDTGAWASGLWRQNGSPKPIAGAFQAVAQRLEQP